MSEVKKKAEKFIDVKKVFIEKNPSLGKLIPGFIFRFIARVVHQDDINDFIENHKHLQGLPFVKAVLVFFNIKLVIKGNLITDDSRRFVFAANHPLGGMEGVAMTQILAEKYGNIRVPSNDILLKLKNFSPYFIPINKHGSNSKDAVIALDKTFEGEHQILMFPAGYVSRKNKGVVEDTEWKKTFISKAIKHKREVVPVFIDGNNSKLFYRVGVIRSFLHVKANLEMFLLPDEMFKQRNRTITITFGEPVHPDFFDKSIKQPVWAERMRAYIYKLRDNEKLKFVDFVDELKE